MKRVLAALLSVIIAAPGCATVRRADNRFVQQTIPSAPDTELLAGYVKRLPIGARVRARLTDGDSVHGTLMKASAEGITVQRRTRIPEQPVEIPIEKLRGVELESSDGVARAVGIGVATGAAAGLGVFLMLLAIYAGSD
jgi:hypothetical protein